MVAATITDQMKVYRDTRERAAAAAQASEQSAVAARTAADRAAAVRAELQAKLGELLRKLAAAEAQYAALSPQQRAAVDAAGASHVLQGAGGVHFLAHHVLDLAQYAQAHR